MGLGPYSLDVIVTSTNEIDSHDRCHGSFLGSRNELSTGQQTLYFNVSNTNLDPSAPSYVSNAPMTDAEAQSALPQALSNCKAQKVGEPPSGD